MIAGLSRFKMVGNLDIFERSLSSKSINKVNLMNYKIVRF